MKVLILHTDFKETGGVGQYYGKLKGKFSLHIQHCIIGKRPGEKGLRSRIYRSLNDYFRFIKRLANNQIEIVHANPSLDPKSLLRDGIFLLSARIMKRKTILFIRGWSKAFELKLERWGLWLFKLLYWKTNAFIVLSTDFKKKLQSWGFKQPIHLEVTIADDNTLEGFDIHQTLSDRLQSEKWRVLFISRIFKSKGIYETIKAVSILRAKYPEIELTVAGDGDELENVKSFVRNQSFSNVIFTGFVSGEVKKNILKSAHILSFPTRYGEGLPNTIIESMAYGLPVVTRPVGGIADFFKNEEHGFATNSTDPEVIAGLIEKLLIDQELYRKISLFNYKYAQSNFLASQAAFRLEKIYKSV
jgi:glycosyltransferase involved in cell wall biosynthesis